MSSTHTKGSFVISPLLLAKGHGVQGIPSGTLYINDILFTGENESQSLEEKVLKRFAKVGLRARKAKCQIMVPSVNYLVYIIEGITPLT